VKDLSECHFVHHKFYMNWPRCKFGPLLWLTAWAMARPAKWVSAHHPTLFL
jgi:hypothetical protein